MTLVEKILKFYPELSIDDFNTIEPTIVVQNDMDGRGDYIAKWEHPTLARPTQAQLDEVTE